MRPIHVSNLRKKYSRTPQILQKVILPLLLALSTQILILVVILKTRRVTLAMPFIDVATS